MKVKIEHQISYQLFEDVIVTAIEGGCNYWYDIHDDISHLKQKHQDLCLSQAIAKELWDNSEFELNIYDIETEDLLGRITKEKCEKAFQIMSEKYKLVLLNITEETYDANDADTFFQLVVMGEIVFG